MMSKKEKMTFMGMLRSDIEIIKNDLNDKAKRNALRRRTNAFLISLFRALLLIGLCFIVLMPLFQKISFAMRHPSDISNPQVIWVPQKLSWLNISIAYDILDFWNSLFNTTLLSFGNMILQIIATAIAGYAFARLRFKGSNILFAIVLFTLVVPYETLHASRKMFFLNTPFLGIYLNNTIFSLFIMSAFGMGIRSAIFIYIFRQFFRNLPMELEESAQVDGAGVIRTFWSVMLPNARGAIITVGLFSFVWQWNDYYFASLFRINRLVMPLTGKKFALLTTSLAGATERLDTVIRSKPYIARLVGQSIYDDPLFLGLIANTAALLIMLPLLISYFFVQRLFVESIERTGITGM